jgi:hypothetical protein
MEQCRNTHIVVNGAVEGHLGTSHRGHEGNDNGSGAHVFANSPECVEARSGSRLTVVDSLGHSDSRKYHVLLSRLCLAQEMLLARAGTAVWGAARAAAAARTGSVRMVVMGQVAFASTVRKSALSRLIQESANDRALLELFREHRSLFDVVSTGHLLARVSVERTPEGDALVREVGGRELESLLGSVEGERHASLRRARMLFGSLTTIMEALASDSESLRRLGETASLFVQGAHPASLTRAFRILAPNGVPEAFMRATLERLISDGDATRHQEDVTPLDGLQLLLLLQTIGEGTTNIGPLAESLFWAIDGMLPERLSHIKNERRNAAAAARAVRSFVQAALPEEDQHLALRRSTTLASDFVRRNTASDTHRSESDATPLRAIQQCRSAEQLLQLWKDDGHRFDTGAFAATVVKLANWRRSVKDAKPLLDAMAEATLRELDHHTLPCPRVADLVWGATRLGMGDSGVVVDCVGALFTHATSMANTLDPVSMVRLLTAVQVGKLAEGEIAEECRSFMTAAAERLSAEPGVLSDDQLIATASVLTRHGMAVPEAVLDRVERVVVRRLPEQLGKSDVAPFEARAMAQAMAVTADRAVQGGWLPLMQQWMSKAWAHRAGVDSALLRQLQTASLLGERHDVRATIRALASAQEVAEFALTLPDPVDVRVSIDLGLQFLRVKGASSLRAELCDKMETSLEGASRVSLDLVSHVAYLGSRILPSASLRAACARKARVALDDTVSPTDIARLLVGLDGSDTELDGALLASLSSAIERHGISLLPALMVWNHCTKHASTMPEELPTKILEGLNKCPLDPASPAHRDYARSLVERLPTSKARTRLQRFLTD